MYTFPINENYNVCCSPFVFKRLTLILLQKRALRTEKRANIFLIFKHFSHFYLGLLPVKFHWSQSVVILGEWVGGSGGKGAGEAGKEEASRRNTSSAEEKPSRIYSL